MGEGVEGVSRLTLNLSIADRPVRKGLFNELNLEDSNGMLGEVDDMKHLLLCLFFLGLFYFCLPFESYEQTCFVRCLLDSMLASLKRLLC